MKVIKTAKLAGEDTITLPHYFTELAYKSVPINHTLPYWDWYDNVKDSIESEDRLEYVVYDDDGYQLGAMVFARDNDPIIGLNLSVRFAFCHTPSALKAGYRWLLQCAKHLGYKHVFMTRLKEYKTYELVYREVK